MKKNFLSKIISIMLVILLIIPQVILNVGAAGSSSPQTRGIAASILRDTALTSDNNSPTNVNNKYNFTLTITGTALAEIGMDDKKTAVFAVPPELFGKVTPKSKIIVDATFLPFALKDITAIAIPLAAVGKAVDVLVAMGAKLLPPVDLKFVKTAYDAMISQKISSYHAEITATVSADGRMIYANFNNDLNTYVVNSLKNLITTFSEVLKMVPSSVVALQAPLNALTSAINTLKAGLTVATIGPSLNANFLSTTTASLAVEVTSPTTASSVFKGDIVSNSTIDVSLFDGLVGSSTIAFDDPWGGYIIPIPTVAPVNTNSTTVTGNISLAGAPAGTTFTAEITIGSNPPQTVTVDGSGNFTYTITEPLIDGEIVSVKVTATKGGETQDSTETATITAGDPWDGYIITTPTINPVNTNSTTVTGNISLAGAPAGTTFTAEITIGTNPPQTVTVDGSGNFTYTITEPLIDGEIVSVKVTATKGGETQDSTETATITDPWGGYTITTPTINPVNTNSTTVTGNISLAGAPAGTTFTAEITIGTNPPQTVTVDGSGNFTYTITEPLIDGEIVSVKVTATKGGETQDSTETVTITAGDPWGGYIIPIPTVAPVNTNSTTVTGNISLAGAPAGTTFTAEITIGSNLPQTVTVDGSGNFTYTITEPLIDGEIVSVKVTATKGGETQDSTETVTITDPWDGYIITTPTINPVNTNSTTVTGSVGVTGAPTGTVFTAEITIGSSLPQTVTVDGSGNFTYTITEALSVGDTVSVKVTATKGGETQDATGTVTITDPWEGYIIPIPTVAPVNTNSTTVTGSVGITGAPTGTVFTAEITIGSSLPQTVTVDASGNFTYTITEALSVGDTVSVVITATKGGETQDSTETVTITDPWDGYIITTPTINPVNTNSTTVTGNISLAGAPTGTVFTAEITIGSNLPQTVTVDASGNFAYTITEPLIDGEIVSVKVTATKGGETQDSTETVTITAGDPWGGYIIPIPTVAPVNTLSTTVTGNISLAGAPAGTTFTAEITIGTNPPQTVTVDASGNFTYTITEALSIGGSVSVVVTATKGGETQYSTGTVTITDPWEGYIIPIPTVAPVNTNSTTVTGSVGVTGAPTGTVFTAEITIGSSLPQTVTVDGSGNFTYTITEALSVGDTVSVKVTATKGGETQDATGTVTITDPWEGYIIPIPTVAPVNTNSTTVTGSVGITGAPTGTVFTAEITIGSSLPQTVTVDASGNFTYTITEALSVGDTVSVVITATKGGETQDSTETVTITDPWEGYIIPIPTVAPVNTLSTTVTGSVGVTGAPTGTVFTAEITIGSSLPQTVTVDASGNFSYTITEALSIGGSVSVVVTATKGGETQDSTETVTITDPWEGYIIPIPTVAPVNTNSTTVTGSVGVTGAPTGTVFTAEITIGTNPPQTVTVDASGNFTYTITEALSIGGSVSVVVTATKGGETQDSTETVTITDPWEGYIIPIPTVAPVNTNSTTVTGSVGVIGAPTGTTFEAEITIGTNPPQTVTVDAVGNFTYTITEPLIDGEIVSVKVTATKGGETQDSTEIVTITAGSSDPWGGYIIPIPTVAPVNTLSTAVTGSVGVTGAPTGTVFTAEITIGTNPPQTVTVDASGNFTYTITEALSIGGSVSVVVTATKGGETQDSTGTATITDPWEGYIIPIPTVAPVNTLSTTVTGSVGVTGAPTGTVFTAEITIGSNLPQTVTVDAVGNFTYTITEALSVGDTVSVVVTATKGGETQDATGTVAITAGDPWGGYTITTPTINPVNTNSTTVTGSVGITGAPAGTTFEAEITIGTNPPQTVTVDASGNFTYTITEPLIDGEIVSVKVTATKGGETQDSTEIVTITAGSSDPWGGYIIPIPTVAPVNTLSTTVTGSVGVTGAPTGTVFTAEITIGTNPPQTVTVDASGNFTYTITEALSIGGSVSVVVTATKGGETQDSTGTATITDPWEGYIIPIPTVAPVNTLSTTVTGSVGVTGAPTGTVFTAEITIGSNLPQTVTVDAVGNFTYTITEALSVGDTVSVVVTATKGGETQDATGTVAITAGDPWGGYTITTPTINPVNTNSTTVTGSVGITGAPAGTTFEAEITIGTNPPQTVTVDASGNFTYTITEALSVGDIVSVTVTATNPLGETKSTTETVTIGAGSGVVLGSSRSSGGSGGGSSRADRSSSLVSAPSSDANVYWGCLSGQSNPLTLKQATELFNTSLQNMQKSTTTLVLRAYNRTNVDISVLNSLKDMADKNGICVVIYFDYVVNKAVVSRIQINPATATKSINLCLVARKNSLPKTNYLIKTYGDNVLRLEFAQKIDFGVSTSVTIKLPQNYKGDCIDFYQLDPASGIYTKISPAYCIDSKRYLEFNINTTENIYICGK